MKQVFPWEPELVGAARSPTSRPNWGEVRPIELQGVGAQLQRGSTSRPWPSIKMWGHHPKGAPGAKGVLDNVVQDCRSRKIFLWPTWCCTCSPTKTGTTVSTAPKKTQEALEEELDLRGVTYGLDQLDLVLEILVGFRRLGGCSMIPEWPQRDRYQLVHDYLVSYVRQEHIPELSESCSKD